LPVANLQMPAAGAHRFSDKNITDDAEVIAAIRALAKFEQQTKTVKIGEGKDQTDSEDPYYSRELSFLKGKNGVASRELPKPGGTGEFEVVGIPLQKPGFHIVEIESRMLGAALLATSKPMYVRTSVLVTNLAVHLKRGKDNGLIWVTALDSGKPVAGAEVRVSDCDGKFLWQGRSDAQGRALVDVALPAESSCDNANFIFASARLGEDYSFVRSDWNEGIEAWRFGVEQDPYDLRPQPVPRRANGVDEAHRARTQQPLLRLPRCQVTADRTGDPPRWQQRRVPSAAELG